MGHQLEQHAVAEGEGAVGRVREPARPVVLARRVEVHDLRVRELRVERPDGTERWIVASPDERLSIRAERFNLVFPVGTTFGAR